jgi:fused signal recognition particle receptor
MFETGPSIGYNALMPLKGPFPMKFPSRLAALFGAGKDREELLSGLEEQLILADVALPVSERIVANIARKSRVNASAEQYAELLRLELLGIFAGPQRQPLAGGGKGILLLVGVNGCGKTTTAAKLARFYRTRGRRVLMAAADTFRAAGSTQLSLWGDRLSIPVVGGERGADPGSVVYNSVQSWRSRDFDLLVIDTAGRVQSRENLMKELEKIIRIIRKFDPAQPAESWLVLDASTGQNALVQAEKFREFSAINGLVLAKLDGTAKGGTVVSIAAQMGLPVLFTGHGETEDDLWEFSPAEFVDSLLER